jgi:hypothetical protein
MEKSGFAQGFLALRTISTIHVFGGLGISPDASGVSRAATWIEQTVALRRKEV